MPGEQAETICLVAVGPMFLGRLSTAMIRFSAFSARQAPSAAQSAGALHVVPGLVIQFDDAFGRPIFVEVGTVLGQAAGVGGVDRVDGRFPIGAGADDGVDVGRGARFGAGAVLSHLGDARVDLRLARHPIEPAMLRQLVVARLEACNHFRVDLVAALARKLEVPGIALLFDLVELHQVRIVAALGARVVRDMGVLHREDRIVERAVSQIVHLEFLLRLGNLAILRVDGTAVEDEDEVHHFLGLDRFAEVHQLLHAELLGLATLAVKHLLLVFREFHSVPWLSPFDGLRFQYRRP